MSFATMMAAAKASAQVEIEAGWGQGRASFGGLVAAVLLARLSAEVPSDRRLRSMSISFVGPVAPGLATLETTVFRSGKSVTQAEARLLQNGGVQAVLLASYGAHRESALRVPSALLSEIPVPADGRPMPYLPGRMPEFLQQFEMVWSEGGFPFSGQDKPDFMGSVRFRDTSVPFTLEHFVALVDTWPPSVLPMMTTLAPASTLCWTLELLEEALDPDPAAWWHYRVCTDLAADGYGHAGARLWAADGRLVAVSRQTVTVFG
jgi:acyl-CoA thioesterase